MQFRSEALGHAVGLSSSSYPELLSYIFASKFIFQKYLVIQAGMYIYIYVYIVYI